jgi:hypothetical protein
MNIKTILPFLALVLDGCTGINQNYVISATGTVIGIEVAQNPANQMYHAKLGYVRSELALVPTNKGTNGVPANSGGAKDTANVLMEMKFSGIFSPSGGIYQRLAVGDKAVAQQGAAIMFAKDADGKLSTNVLQHIKSIPLAP